MTSYIETAFYFFSIRVSVGCASQQPRGIWIRFPPPQGMAALTRSLQEYLDHEEEEEHDNQQLRKKRQRDLEDDDTQCMIAMSSSFVLTEAVISSTVLGKPADYHHDKARWESAKDFFWLSSVTSRYHFIAFFRFTPEELERVSNALSLPEFVPTGVRVKIPAKIGLCMLLMRYYSYYPLGLHPPQRSLGQYLAYPPPLLLQYYY